MKQRIVQHLSLSLFPYGLAVQKKEITIKQRKTGFSALFVIKKQKEQVG